MGWVRPGFDSRRSDLNQTLLRFRRSVLRIVPRRGTIAVRHVTHVPYMHSYEIFAATLKRWRNLYLELGVPIGSLPDEQSLEKSAATSVVGLEPILVPSGLAVEEYGRLVSEVHQHLARSGLILSDVPRSWFYPAQATGVRWTTARSYWQTQSQITARYGSGKNMSLFATLVYLLDLTTFQHPPDAVAHAFWSRTCSMQCCVVFDDLDSLRRCAYVVSTSNVIDGKHRLGRFAVGNEQYRNDCLAPFCLRDFNPVPAQ